MAASFPSKTHPGTAKRMSGRPQAPRAARATEIGSVRAIDPSKEAVELGYARAVLGEVSYHLCQQILADCTLLETGPWLA
jgi:hypothetical protein